MTADPAPEDPDAPGLAGERTDLAWSRTAMAAGVAGAALLRHIWERVDPGDGRAFVFSLLAVGAAVWATSLRWSQAAARTTLHGRRVAEPAALRRVAAGTALFCAVALVLALLPA